jgi:hypothetical protein
MFRLSSVRKYIMDCRNTIIKFGSSKFKRKTSEILIKLAKKTVQKKASSTRPRARQ